MEAASEVAENYFEKSTRNIGLMTDIRSVASTTPTRVQSDDSVLAPHLLRDGSLVSSDWELARSLEGRVFVANAGTVTTPLTFGAGVIDTTEPDLHIAIPSGTTAILLGIQVQVEAFGTTAIFEGMAAIGTGGSAGTDTAVTPTSLRADAPISSNATVGAAGDADATYMTTNVSEFWRFGIQKAATTATGDDDSSRDGERWEWNSKERGIYPVLVGPAQLQVHAAGQATTGFIIATWVEVPSNSVS